MTRVRRGEQLVRLWPGTEKCDKKGVLKALRDVHAEPRGAQGQLEIISLNRYESMRALFYMLDAPNKAKYVLDEYWHLIVAGTLGIAFTKAFK
jgi:hypothetical protein